MERCRVKIPNNNEFYTARDLQVGATIEFRKHLFKLIEADEYTLNFMENKKFPASDVTLIFEKIKEKLIATSASVTQAFRRLDKDASGFLSMEEFRSIVHGYNFDLTDQELISVMRKFDNNFDGVVNYEEFCNTVLGQDYTPVEAPPGAPGVGPEKIANDARPRPAAKLLEEEDARRQEKLMEIVNFLRVQLHDKREQVAHIFQGADAAEDGQVGVDDFIGILKQVQDMLPADGLQFNEEECNLMVESFADPDFPDQTRPMSIAVLDQALFA